jgi:serine O-acetyltransferase
MLLRMIGDDLRRKAQWCYGSDRPPALLKVLFSDGTMAMIFYRLMQWSRRRRLAPLEMVFNKANAVCCQCIIGRGAEFGPGLVLIHAMGIVINGQVRGGANVSIEHQVTIGAERRVSPTLGDDVFIGAGAKIYDVPPHSTAVGIPARPVWRSTPLRLMDDVPEPPDWLVSADEPPPRADQPGVAVLRDGALGVAMPPAPGPGDWPPSGGGAPEGACGPTGPSGDSARC